MPGCQSVFIRGRPRTLLKSPSADSENSDPIRPPLLKADSTSSSSIGTLERRSRKYKTNSSDGFTNLDYYSYDFLTTICYDFFFYGQTEKNNCFGLIRISFSFSTAQIEKKCEKN